ncbi:MAG: hypothetical protein ACI3WQ_09240 [Faecousia sp.]
MKRFSGFTEGTMKKRLLDAGAFYKNYDLTKDHPQNRAAGKLICATQGGGSFAATPSVRQVKVDGLATYTKGTEEVNDWTAELSLKLLENDAHLMAMCLGAASVEKTSGEKQPTGYLRVHPKDTFENDDYIDNVVWIGRWADNKKPVMIVIYNALSLGGLNWAMEDNKEVVTECKLTAHYDAPDAEGNQDVPFDIFYPEVAEQEVAEQEVATE